MIGLILYGGAIALGLYIVVGALTLHPVAIAAVVGIILYLRRGY